MPTAKQPFVDFKALKQTVTMEQVLQHYGLLDGMTRKGDALSGKNPFDASSTNKTRFRVSISKNCWNLFGSDQHGNIIDFVMQMEGIGLTDAAEKLAEWFGVSEGKQTPTRSTKEHDAPPPPEEPEDSTEPNKPLGFELNLDTDAPYLTERGLDVETIATFGIGYCNKGTMKGRIAIPIRNGAGEIVAYMGRWPGEPPDEETPKYKFPKGFRKSLEVFNLDLALAEHSSPLVPLVIVEGVFDCMHLWQLGHKKVVSIFGSEISNAQRALISEHFGGTTKSIFVALDGDDAGRSGRTKVMDGLGDQFWMRTCGAHTEGWQPTDIENLEELKSLWGQI